MHSGRGVRAFVVARVVGRGGAGPARLPAATFALGAALAATVYSRTFGWALVFGIAAWAAFARRDLIRPVAGACAIAIVAYVPFLLWNASVGWETFAFEFVHRQSVTTFSAAKLVDLDTLRFLVFGGLIVGLAWLVALRRPPRLPLVAWTAIPLPAALFVLSFAMRTESYWILGPAASLAVGCGAVLARTNVLARRSALGALGIATAYAVVNAVFLALPEAVQAAAFHSNPAFRMQFKSGVYAYRPLADDLRADAAAGITLFTDRYETSGELLWYGLPSDIVVITAQLPQWMRWYRPPVVPQRADLIAFRTPFGDNPDFERNVRAAYASVGTPQRLDYRYADEPEGTFYRTRLADPRPNAASILPGL